MKKMFALMAIMVIATLSEAATIQWGSNGAAYFDANRLSATANDNGVAYLIAFEGGGGAVTAGMIAAAYDNWKGTTYNNVVAGPQASAGTGLMGTTYIIADGAAMGSSGLNLTEDATYFANIFFTTRDGQDYYYQSGSTLYDQQGAYWTAATSTLDVRSSLPSGTTWTTIPEPTSMALLALGAAAIGLRRKFRA